MIGGIVKGPYSEAKQTHLAGPEVSATSFTKAFHNFPRHYKVKITVEVWALHQIRRQMDKVDFFVDGQKVHSLVSMDTTQHSFNQVGCEDYSEFNNGQGHDEVTTVTFKVSHNKPSMTFSMVAHTPYSSLDNRAFGFSGMSIEFLDGPNDCLVPKSRVACQTCDHTAELQDERCQCVNRGVQFFGNEDKPLACDTSAPRNQGWKVFRALARKLARKQGW